MHFFRQIHHLEIQAERANHVDGILETQLIEHPIDFALVDASLVGTPHAREGAQPLDVVIRPRAGPRLQNVADEPPKKGDARSKWRSGITFDGLAFCPVARQPLTKVSGEHEKRSTASNTSVTDPAIAGKAHRMQNDQVQNKIFEMDKTQLDAYPDGVITLDRTGIIKRYNKTEAMLARREAGETMGLNFFTDVAPCTAVKDFKGRFDTFAKGEGSGVERFDFTFRFAWGRQDVGITMIRRAGVDEINVLVARRSEKT